MKNKTLLLMLLMAIAMVFIATFAPYLASAEVPPTCQELSRMASGMAITRFISDDEWREVKPYLREGWWAYTRLLDEMVPPRSDEEKWALAASFSRYVLAQCLEGRNASKHRYQTLEQHPCYEATVQAVEMALYGYEGGDWSVTEEDRAERSEKVDLYIVLKGLRHAQSEEDAFWQGKLLSAPIIWTCSTQDPQLEALMRGQLER